MPCANNNLKPIINLTHLFVLNDFSMLVSKAIFRMVNFSAILYRQKVEQRCDWVKR